MEWRKVKNIIIILLLVVNGFLLVIVGARWGEVRRYEQSALSQAAQVLERNGIAVNMQGLAEVEEFPVLTAERSIAAERALAETMLGAAVQGDNQGGGLYTYHSDMGTVRIRSGGQIDIQLNAQDRWNTEDPEGLLRQLADDLGLEIRIWNSDLTDHGGTLMFYQLWEGNALFSCQMKASFQENCLVALSGRLVLTEEWSEESCQLLTLPTALLRFMDEVSARGDVCSALVSMEPGYRMIQSFSSAIQLEPVWLISSNTGDYYMDAVSGELNRLTEN